MTQAPERTPIQTDIHTLRTTSPEESAKAIFEVFRSRPSKERMLLLDWHRRYVSAADQLRKDLQQNPVPDPTFDAKVREAAIARSFAILCAQEPDVAILAIELFAPEDVLRGSVRMNAKTNATPMETQEWLQLLAQFEARWITAFVEAQQQASTPPTPWPGASPNRANSPDSKGRQ